MQSFEKPINFYLVGVNKLHDVKKDYEMVLDQLGTYGGVGIDKTTSSSATISYEDTTAKAVLEIEKSHRYPDRITSKQMILTCEQTDGVSINIIRQVINRLGYKAFNPALGCFMVSDSNLLDLTAGELDLKISKIFRTMNFTPLFNFRNSHIYFARPYEKTSIHLVNQHLLAFFLDKNIIDKNAKDFSVEVAKDIGRFVALYSRGLLFRDFYKIRDKLFNLSGFDENKVSQDVFLRPLFFRYQKNNQTFKQFNANLNPRQKILKGKGFKNYPSEVLEKYKIAEDYIVTKVNRQVSFDTDEKGKRIPSINISIFLDS